MNWLRQRLWPSSDPNNRLVTDKQGRTHRIRVSFVGDVPDQLCVYYRNQFVGLSKLIWYLPMTVVIEDIQIRMPYRQRGLGTVLLREMIALARAQNVKTICGFITRSDYQVTPSVLGWYAKHGFRITYRPDASHVVADLALDLNGHKG